MARTPLQVNKSLPYHVTARTNNRETFHVPLAQLWEIIGEECLNLAWVYGAEFHAFVLMPNHFHLLITTPEQNLGVTMNEFLKSVSRRSNRLSDRTGHVFGGPYHRSLIRDSRYFAHALKYVYRNPVRAKLCDHAEDYPFSTLRGLLGLAPLAFPISFTRSGLELSLPAMEPVSQLGWLNSPLPKETEALVRAGLRRRLFDAIMDRKTRRPLEKMHL
jgi:putative transposase